ncbi:MAG TPA: asparagine synthase (glutamine-hydrolyzing) [Candidatus Binataceae bacterium]|nr:asparagine synthase (glutamine-hydrolyzing) [Candidatus Binataceae bacterium]
MCGIVGLLSFGANVAGLHDSIRRSVDLMVRRGPDDEGIWSDGRACILGFRRLAILDLSPAGHQPMISSDGRFALVFNGEVYNFREIRRDLEREGIGFRSSGDTEVVLQALARWGTAALAKFNGMFALCFYDARAGQLLISRDHAGIKPLYYLKSPAGFLFASQYDQILAHPWSRGCAPVPEHMALYHHLGYIPAPYAWLRDTYALEPGSWLKVDLNRNLTRGRHFTLPLYSEPELRDEAAQEAVDAAVTAAVKRHLVSDVPVGVFLSGGIDSPLVTAKMVKATGTHFPAFTLSTGGDQHDEAVEATTYAKELGVEHHLCTITPSIAMSMLDDVIAACGEPMDDYSMFPTMLVSRYARERVKVVLSGDGADEIFFGYTNRMVPYFIRQTPSPWRGNWLEKAKGLYRRAFLPARETAGETYMKFQSSIAGGWAKTLFPDLAAFPSDFKLFEKRRAPANQLAQWMRWNEFSGHLTKVLLKVDRASMYHSLEVRVPLLDREVVELASRIDWRSCIDLDRKLGKLPLRSSLARHVRFQSTAKRGFTVPMSEWMRGPLRPIFEDIVMPRGDIAGLPVDRKALHHLFSQHLDRTSDYGWGLWRLLSICLWENRHYARFAHTG